MDELREDYRLELERREANKFENQTCPKRQRKIAVSRQSLRDAEFFFESLMSF